MKNDFVMPILVLSLICVLVSGALAATNGVTEPIIAQAAAERAEAARMSIIPEATGFELIELDGAPATVREVYKSSNNVGYIFMVTASGYGGDIKMICGINVDGKIIRCTVLEQSETKGLGSKITEPQFQNQFDGRGSDLDGISAISGATISSTAYINAVKDAFTAYELIRGVK